MTTTTDHTGHRERMRERIRQNGLDSLQPHEILEYLLFSFVPRRNTNDIAHRLIAEFGSLSNVLDAPYESLVGVEGMTKNAALFLTSLPAIDAVCCDEKRSRAGHYDNPTKAAQYLCSRIGNLPYECFAALCLDAKGNLLGVVQFRSSGANYVHINVRELVRRLVLSRAVNVVIAHNHPSGNTTPSDQDVALYKYLQEVMRSVDINILDCMIVAGNKYFSFFSNYDLPTAKQARIAADPTKPSRKMEDDEENEFNLLFPSNTL